MIWISLVLNCLLFFAIMNLGRWFKFRHNPVPGSFRPLILQPVTLGTALTLVDSLRLVFFQEVVLYIITAILIYWLFSIFQRK